MTGGVTAITTFFPLNNVRMRLQVDDSLTPGNPLAVAKQIADKDGVGALYQGWWSSVVSLGASNFVYFYVYNAFKTLYAVKVLGDRKGSIDAVTNLGVAAAAGVINVLCTTPLWVVGTRLATQRKKASTGGANSKPYLGIADCLSRIMSEEGVPALWKGVGPSLILVSNPSIQFVAYERLRGPMQEMAEKRGSPLSNLEFFIMGFIAKAIATILTYPLQIAQSKMRANRNKEDKSGKGANSTTVGILLDLFEKEGLKGLFKGMEAKLYQTCATAAFQFLMYERVKQMVTKLLLDKEV